MALDFPSNPTTGQVFGNYTYDSTIPGWRKSPELASGMPAGSIIQWAGATAPANWLIADGSAVSRTTYASLFAAIGVLYGSGDGTTTFNLPDLRGKVAVGKNSGTFGTLGATGGEEAHTLTTAEMPVHNHTISISDPGHTHSNSLSSNTVASSSHTHGTSTLIAAVYAGYWKQRAGTYYTTTNSGGLSAPGGDSRSTNGGVSIEGSTDGPSATTTVGLTNASATTGISATSANAGSGSAHNNLQPYLVVNYIIKTSAGITSGDSELATRVGVVEAQNNLTPISPNYVINGAFDVWQRGTSVSHAGGAVGCDMWREYTDSGTGTQSKDTTDYPVGQSQSYKFTSSAASTNWTLWSIIESANSAPLAGQTVTLSAWLKTSVARTIRLYANYSTTTDATWTGTWSAIGQTDISTTTSWSRFTYTFTVPVTTKTLQVGFISAGVNLGSSATVSVAGVQLELGSLATTFRRSATSLQGELAACQRYYYRVDSTDGLYTVMASGKAYNTNLVNFEVKFPVPMRARPSLPDVSAMSTFYAEYGSAAVLDPTSFNLNQIASRNVAIFDCNKSGAFTAGAYYILISRNTTGAYLGFSAEL